MGEANLPEMGKCSTDTVLGMCSRGTDGDWGTTWECGNLHLSAEVISSNVSETVGVMGLLWTQRQIPLGVSLWPLTDHSKLGARSIVWHGIGILRSY